MPVKPFSWRLLGPNQSLKPLFAAHMGLICFPELSLAPVKRVRTMVQPWRIGGCWRAGGKFALSDLSYRVGAAVAVRGKS
jgi:hypothetical protein